MYKTQISRVVQVGLLAAVLAFTPVSFKAHAEGAGMAGCGLGSIAVKKNNWLQIFATTLNGLFSNQTFAISTGSSNCDGGSLGDAMKSSKRFVETNREVLAKEIARGGGENIASLSTLAGCQDAAVVGASLQQGFTDIFDSATLSDSEVGERVVNHLKTESSLSCTL